MGGNDPRLKAKETNNSPRPNTSDDSVPEEHNSDGNENADGASRRDDEPLGRRRLMVSLTGQDARRLDSLMRWTLISLVLLSSSCISSSSGQDLAPMNWGRPGGMPKITELEVMCGNEHMEVHLKFDKPFNGLVTSKGMYGQGDCIYVPPRTGQSAFVFKIFYNKCGTKPDTAGKFYENTVVVQYDEELIEAWDEAKRLRCEWFSDYEKTATKTNPVVMADLEITELNFHGDNVDCWMEVQEGKGPWAPPLNGIAALGSPLTMVIAVKDPSGEFDMRVKNCEATDGGHSQRSLALSDAEGCILRPKLLGKFAKVKLDDGRATVLTYAYINAFKFPDMLNVHLRCTVEICRHGCPDHCTGTKDKETDKHVPAQSQVATQTARPHAMFLQQNPPSIVDSSEETFMRPPPPPQRLYGGRPQRAPRPHPAFFGHNRYRLPGSGPLPLPGMLRQNNHLRAEPKSDEIQDRSGEPVEDDVKNQEEGKAIKSTDGEEEVGGKEREMLMKEDPTTSSTTTSTSSTSESTSTSTSTTSSEAFPKGPRRLRFRRSVELDTVGVMGAFRVVSPVDLNFALDPNGTLATPRLSILKETGKESIHYGVCIPKVGFSFVLLGLGLAILVATLIAAFLAYIHHTVQSRTEECQAQCQPGSIHPNPTALYHQFSPLVIMRKMW